MTNIIYEDTRESDYYYWGIKDGLRVQNFVNFYNGSLFCGGSVSFTQEETKKLYEFMKGYYEE